MQAIVCIEGLRYRLWIIKGQNLKEVEEGDDKPQDLCNIAQEMDFENIKKI